MRIFSCFCMYALCSMQPTKNVAKNLCSLFKCLQRIASFSTLCLPFKFTFFGNAEAFLYKFLLPLFQRSFFHFIFSSSHHFRCQSHYNVLLWGAVHCIVVPSMPILKLFFLFFPFYYLLSKLDLSYFIPLLNALFMVIRLVRV